MITDIRLSDVNATMNNTNPSILFLSYYFPPRPEIGGKRIDKMCAVALQRGWIPIILTTAGERGIDESLAKMYGNVEIHYLNTSIATLKKQARKFSPADIWRKISNRVHMVSQSLRSVFMFVSAGHKLISHKHIGCYVTSYPPDVMHLAGVFLKIAHPNSFWIADFRDPWVFPVSVGSLRSTNLLKRLMLKLVARNADLLVAATASHIRFISQITGSTNSGKYLLLPNSVDLDLFEHVSAQKQYSDQVLTFCHLGDMDYHERNPTVFLEAFSQVVRKGRPLPKCLEMHFWGNCCGRWEGQDIAALVQRFGLESDVFCHGPVSHHEALAIVKGIDVLVLLAFNYDLRIPAKAYEYILSNKPILALCETDSETYNLLIKYEKVVIVRENTVQKIIEGLITVIDLLSVHNPGDFRRDSTTLNYRQCFSPLFDLLELKFK